MRSLTRARVRRSVVGLLAAAVTVGALAVAAVPAGAASAKPDRSAVLRFGVPIEDLGGVFLTPTGVNSGAQSPSNRLMLDLIYDTIITKTPDGKYAPQLATKWATPNGSTVELTLRDDVKFSDGTPFNATAVKTAWDKLLASTRPNLTPTIKAISSIEAPDATTVKVNLKEPVALALLEEMTSSNFLAVPAASSTEAKPVGAGPYSFVSYTPGKVVLTKNGTYYDPKKQYLAGVEFSQVAFGQPSISALQAGTVDLIWQVPPDSVAALKSGGFVVDAVASQRLFAFYPCPTKGPFASKEARQALMSAIDRDAVNTGVLAGTGAPNWTVITPISTHYDKAIAKSIEKQYPYDPKKAKALLAKAGVAEGTTIKVLAPAIAPYNQIAEVLQANLKAVGLNPVVTTTTDYGGDAIRLEPDIGVASGDPSLFPLMLGGQKSALNPCGYSNPEILAALKNSGDASLSPADQQKAWNELVKLVGDEVPIAPSNLQGLVAVHNKKVHGVDVINSPYGPQLNRVYMTK